MRVHHLTVRGQMMRALHGAKKIKTAQQGMGSASVV